MNIKIVSEDGVRGIFESVREYVDKKKYIVTTWENLVEKRESNELIPGCLYRITDYITTVSNDPEARSAGHPFDLIVLALSENTLSEEARAVRSSRETDDYFKDAKFESWRVWYCLDNDTSRFQWASEDGKGVIYRLIDGWGNDCPYDFKNIQFKRYLAAGEILNDSYGGNTYILGADFDNPSLEISSGSDYKWFYTFSIGDNPLQLLSVKDASLLTEIDIKSSELIDVPCRENKIGKLSEGFQQRLNNIVISMFNTGIIQKENIRSIFEGNYNTWDSGCHSMTIFNSCCQNKFESGCYDIVEISPNKNTFGRECYGLTLGHGSESNIFGEGCNMIFSRGYSKYNRIESGSSITFGKSCGYNIIEEGNNISLGKLCFYNTVGRGCKYITFLDGNQYTTLGSNIKNTRIGGGGEDNPINILDGTSGNYSNPIKINVPESPGCYYAGQNSDGKLKIWNPADLMV